MEKRALAFTTFTTARLLIRRLSACDAEELSNIRSDDEINKFIDRKKSTTEEEAREFIRKINERIDNNETLYWAISLKDDKDNTLIGTTCLFNFSPDKTSCELGYELSTAYQRKGIMREAVAQVLKYAVEVAGVKKIEAVIHKDNVQSIKLVDKFRFKRLDEEVGIYFLKYIFIQQD